MSDLFEDATALSPGLPVEPSRGARHLLDGILAQLGGDGDRALRELERAVALDPDNGEARERLDAERARQTGGAMD
jgi:Flp pilus assembly protein TadD